MWFQRVKELGTAVVRFICVVWCFHEVCSINIRDVLGILAVSSSVVHLYLLILAELSHIIPQIVVTASPDLFFGERSESFTL